MKDFSEYLGRDPGREGSKMRKWGESYDGVESGKGKTMQWETMPEPAYESLSQPE